MPIFTGHGQSSLVTYPSMSPETSSARVSPTATVMRARPSSASACPLVRAPGAIHDQKMRMPAAPATKIAYSSSWPCGAMYRKNTSSRSLAPMIAAEIPRLCAFVNSRYGAYTPRIPNATHWAASQALLVHTNPVNDAGGCSE